MSEEKKPVDMEAAAKAVKGGRSLVEHLGMSDQMPRVLYAAAVGHHEAGRYAESIQCLIQATALDARMPDAWALLGNSLMREGRFAEALEAWSLALHLKPGFSAACQVTRTALAIKDAEAASIGFIAMLKHAKTAEQRDTCLELGAAMKNLNAAATAAAPGV